MNSRGQKCDVHLTFAVGANETTKLPHYVYACLCHNNYVTITKSCYAMLHCTQQIALLSKQASSAWTASLSSIAHDLNRRWHYLASKHTQHEHPGQPSSLTIFFKDSHTEQASKLSVSHSIHIFSTHLTVHQWPSALTELHCLAVLDYTYRRKWAFNEDLSTATTKDLKSSQSVTPAD